MNNKLKYFNYITEKQYIVISEKNKNKFRQQTKIERENLKNDLIYHKRILNPLIVRISVLGKELVDGHHRWALLQEVIKECPDFDTNIPYIELELEEVDKQMLRTQLGRRNLSNEEIAQYVSILIEEDGLSKNKAYQKAADDLAKSLSTIKRIADPNLAQIERDRQRENRRNKVSIVSGEKLPNERIGVSDDISSNLTEKTSSNNEDSLEPNKDKSTPKEDKKHKEEKVNINNICIKTETNIEILTQQEYSKELEESLKDYFNNIKSWFDTFNIKY